MCPSGIATATAPRGHLQRPLTPHPHCPPHTRTATSLALRSGHAPRRPWNRGSFGKKADPWAPRPRTSRGGAGGVSKIRQGRRRAVPSARCQVRQEYGQAQPCGGRRSGGRSFRAIVEAVLQLWGCSTQGGSRPCVGQRALPAAGGRLVQRRVKRTSVQVDDDEGGLIPTTTLQGARWIGRYCPSPRRSAAPATSPGRRVARSRSSAIPGPARTGPTWRPEAAGKCAGDRSRLAKRGRWRRVCKGQHRGISHPGA